MGALGMIPAQLLMFCQCRAAWHRPPTCLPSLVIMKQVLQLSARTSRHAACLPAGLAFRVQALDRGFFAVTKLCLCPWSLCALLVSLLQGCMGKAFEYLNMLPGDTAEEVLQLRDRIFNAGAPDLPVGTPQPPFPYEAEAPQPDASVSGRACTHPTAVVHLSSRHTHSLALHCQGGVSSCNYL